MRRFAGALAVPLALGLWAGCAKHKAPAMPDRPDVEIPETWQGVSFDEEIGALGTEFREATDGGQDCGDLLALEPVAMTGGLTDDQITCLDHALRLAARQTTKDTLSRVLMADAWGKRDLHRWEGAVRRHLEEIDRSDPDLSYIFAAYLSKKGPAEAFEAIRYAEFAIENKDQWGAEVHAERVTTLYKIKAIAAQQLWHYYEDQMLFDRSPEVIEHTDRWRANAKAMAREWLEWAHESGDDVMMPYEMCVSAAGTLDYCEIGFEETTSDAG